MRLDFHFGIEVNQSDWLWIHGSVGDHCFRWTLRQPLKPLFWTIDGSWSLTTCIEEIDWDLLPEHQNQAEEPPDG